MPRRVADEALEPVNTVIPRPNEKLEEEVKKVALETAKKMIETNSSPSSALQIDILNTAIELIKVARC